MLVAPSDLVSAAEPCLLNPQKRVVRQAEALPNPNADRLQTPYSARHSLSTLRREIDGDLEHLVDLPHRVGQAPSSPAPLPPLELRQPHCQKYSQPRSTPLWSSRRLPCSSGSSPTPPSPARMASPSPTASPTPTSLRLHGSRPCLDLRARGRAAPISAFQATGAGGREAAAPYQLAGGRPRRTQPPRRPQSDEI